MKIILTLIIGMVLGGALVFVLCYAGHGAYVSGHVVNVENPLKRSVENIVHTYDNGDDALAEAKLRLLDELWHDQYGSVESTREIFEEIAILQNEDLPTHPILWESSSVDLGIPGFRVAVGPMFYQHVSDRGADFYRIEVGRPDGDVTHVLFSRDLPIGIIPLDVMTDETVDLVHYDEEKRTVVFQIGEEEYSYVLPSDP